MSVDTFDPAAQPQALSAADIETLLAAGAQTNEPQYGLSDHEVARLGRLARTDGATWQGVAQELSDDQAEVLIRLLVMAETALPGWESGAKSPVIALVRDLKAAGRYQESLTAWIKANTSNRFLPHGSLLDRL